MFRHRGALRRRRGGSSLALGNGTNLDCHREVGVTILELLDGPLHTVDTLQLDVGGRQFSLDQSLCLQLRRIVRHIVIVVLQHRHEAK